MPAHMSFKTFELRIGIVFTSLSRYQWKRRNSRLSHIWRSLIEVTHLTGGSESEKKHNHSYFLWFEWWERLKRVERTPKMFRCTSFSSLLSFSPFSPWFCGHCRRPFAWRSNSLPSSLFHSRSPFFAAQKSSGENGQNWKGEWHKTTVFLAASKP